ncbi:MAG TPA: hypothetical protein VIZ18_00290 [Ktedonobacteraceae bacterium]
MTCGGEASGEDGIGEQWAETGGKVPGVAFREDEATITDDAGNLAGVGAGDGCFAGHRLADGHLLCVFLGVPTRSGSWNIHTRFAFNSSSLCGRDVV